MSTKHPYTKLLELPLFQGLSVNELNQIIAHTKLNFRKFKADEIIVVNGEACHEISFLMSGTIKVVTQSETHGYTFTEWLKAPQTFQMETLFGLFQTYTHTIVASEECSIISIGKSEVYTLLNSFPIFRINYINLLSKKLQKYNLQLWLGTPTETKDLIIHFITSHCLHPAGAKDIKIKMTQLASEIHDKRLNVSMALNEMQDQHLLKLTRGHIHIDALEKLFNVNASTPL